MCENVFREVHQWFNYFPDELSICRYSANQIMSLEKIKDVFHSLTYGRLCLDNLFATNYGELIVDDEAGLGRAVIRSTIMNNCLSYYNYCIDYSWQVLWLYYSDMDESAFNNMDKYIEFMKACKLEVLNPLLRRKNENVIRRHINTFFNRDEIRRVRKKYNTIKHRGFYHIEGLGANYKESAISIDGDRLPLLHREEIDLNELRQELIEFDNLFVEYFEVIIDKVVPSEIKDGIVREITFEEVIGQMSNLLELINSNNENNTSL